jgi:hypothetical protein
MEEQTKYPLSQKLVDAIANYLVKQPYGQVFQIINMLQYEIQQSRNTKSEDPVKHEVEDGTE